MIWLGQDTTAVSLLIAERSSLDSEEKMFPTHKLSLGWCQCWVRILLTTHATPLPQNANGIQRQHGQKCPQRSRADKSEEEVP